MDGTLLTLCGYGGRLTWIFLAEEDFEVPSDYLEMITPMGITGLPSIRLSDSDLNEKPEDLIQGMAWGWQQKPMRKKVEPKSHAKEYLLKPQKGWPVHASLRRPHRLYELIAPCLEQEMACWSALMHL